MGIAEQMGRTLQRTSVSVNIKDRWASGGGRAELVHGCP
jgi:hypothetical protein